VLPPEFELHWAESFRIIPSRFPPVGLFDDVTDPADLDAVFELEGMTNSRLRQDAGDISLVPPDRRIAGPGTTPIMAAFTHPNPDGSRFSDGRFGVYYAAANRDTAIAETVHHREIFLNATREPTCEVEQRCYVATIRGRVHDIRDGWEAVHDPDSYAASQRLASELYDSRSNGLVYRSVRHSGGQCVAAFYPDLISNCVQHCHLLYRWNGSKIDRIIVSDQVTQR